VVLSRRETMRVPPAVPPGAEERRA
jgi:hypothetical protein